jgi:prolyl 4-hydroxylase
LNDADAGGRTVFPRLGVGTEPIAGAAVFWYNLLESGDADTLTLHGACPMLHGTKWGEQRG